MAEHLQQSKIKVSGHLEERRGIWRMMLSWTDLKGNRGRKSLTTELTLKGNKKRAEEMLRDAIREQETRLSDNTSVGNLLFADYMEQWVESRRGEVKTITFGGYQMSVNSIISPYFREKGTLLTELTSDDIKVFYKKQLERVKATTVHQYHACISKALKLAVEEDYIPRNPMDKVKRPKAERFVGKFLKESEVIALCDAVKGHKLELGVLLGAFYGLRRSEVVGLRWESIDFETNYITIEHTVTVAKVDGKRLVISDDSTKSKSSLRSLPLMPVLRTKLLEVKAEQELHRKLCGKSYNKAESAYIYTDVLGNRIKPDYLSAKFPIFLDQNGFRRIRFHDLRHSCASLLLASGVSLKEIQDWLGHSDFAVTANIYAHLDIGSKLASANALKWIDKTSLANNVADGNLG